MLAFKDVLEDPARMRRVLQNELFGITIDHLLEAQRGGIALDMTCTPLPELEVAGFQHERARIAIWPSGAIYSYPLGSARTWHHRYPSPLGSEFGPLAGEVWLWYPKDPRYLGWGGEGGLEQYVARVYRHLFYEEYYRREGQWPVEDAPHDDPVTGGAHPICSAFMRKEERRWAS